MDGESQPKKKSLLVRSTPTVIVIHASHSYTTQRTVATKYRRQGRGNGGWGGGGRGGSLNKHVLLRTFALPPQDLPVVSRARGCDRETSPSIAVCRLFSVECNANKNADTLWNGKTGCSSLFHANCTISSALGLSYGMATSDTQK